MHLLVLEIKTKFAHIRSIILLELKENILDFYFVKFRCIWCLKLIVSVVSTNLNLDISLFMIEMIKIYAQF